MELEELAQRTGESVETLREWQAARLLGESDRFDLGDAERARLIRFLLRRGYDVETIARADRAASEHGLLDRFLAEMFPSGEWRTLTLEEAVEKTPVEPDVAERLLAAAGLIEPGAPAGEDDVEALKGLAIALDAGLPEAAVIQMVRVYADSLRRVAEAEARLVHTYLHERLRAEGLSGRELVEVTEAAADRLRQLSEPTIRYFHQRGWLDALRDDLALHVAEDAGLAGPDDVPGRLTAAIVFIDLARFTPLTEAMGDAAAAEVIERFSTLVRRAATKCHGRVVKQIGDEFMLMFFEPTSAVTCAVEVEERARHEPMFPGVRMGAHWGPVLYREGDYVGATVNIAARITAEADAHELLVTSQLRQETGELPAIEYVPVGARKLKGVTEELELYAARRTTEALSERHLDPVCGMELGAAEIAARLDVGGTERVFCSGECLQRFVAAPERYADVRRG